MLRNRMYLAGGKLAPFSEKLIDQICMRSLGLPGVAIELAENIMRRSELFELQECDGSYLELFVDTLGITTAEQILQGVIVERQMVLTSGLEVPVRDDEETITITGTRQEILEVILSNEYLVASAFPVMTKSIPMNPEPYGVWVEIILLAYLIYGI